MSDNFLPGPEHFSTTHWSLVARATDKVPEALSLLCQRYWVPLYAYVRRAGYSIHDAQDLTQAFFTRFLEKDYLDDVDRERGKFRSFLLAALRNFLLNARDEATAQKRGGGRVHLSFDFQQAEERYVQEPVEAWTAEKLFHRRWALDLLQSVLERLQSECNTPDKTAFFQAAQGFLGGDMATRSHAELAEELGMTVGAVKTALHRLRRRYRDLLREEIAHTVAHADQVDEELQQLLAALRGE